MLAGVPGTCLGRRTNRRWCFLSYTWGGALKSRGSSARRLADAGTAWSALSLPPSRLNPAVLRQPRIAELFVVRRLVEANQREAFAEHQRPLDELAIAGQ